MQKMKPGDMEKVPFFSVIIPVYNKEPHVSRSICSVLSQTFTKFELIIVCDPSTDNSNLEVAKFSDPRIRVFHRILPGPGGYAARNLGIMEAHADWIVFLDADDEWFPEHLDNTYHAIQDHVGSSIFSCGWLIYDNDSYKLDNYSNKKKNIHTIDFEQYLINEIEKTRPICTLVACIKKDLLISVGLFPEGKITMGGDVDTWLRCIAFSGAMVWSPHKGAIYYNDSINMVTKSSIIDPELHLQTLARMLKTEMPESTKRLLKLRCNNLLTVAWNQNMRMNVKENFPIGKMMFFEVQPFKVSLYLVFSTLPMPVARLIHSHLTKLLKLMRRIRFKAKSINI